MKKISMFLLLVLSLATLTACAPGSKSALDKNDSQILLTMPGVNPEQGKPAENGNVAGLGTGLFHGLISVVTLVLCTRPIIPDPYITLAFSLEPCCSLPFWPSPVAGAARFGLSSSSGIPNSVFDHLEKMSGFKERLPRECGSLSLNFY